MVGTRSNGHSALGSGFVRGREVLDAPLVDSTDSESEGSVDYGDAEQQHREIPEQRKLPGSPIGASVMEDQARRGW